MADQLLDQVRDALDGQIDFDGQRRSEVAATLLLALSAFIGFNVGYFTSDILLAAEVALGGSVLVFLLTVPGWSFWKVNPVKWLPAGAGTGPTIVQTSQ